jgi:hypothetical protein
VGDRTFAVGDLVVLGANAKDRLGVVNGTTAVIVGLDPQSRAMTARTLEDDPPRVVRLPGWYLDAAVRPGQSRRVDLAYARTDMRSQGRTERRALLALDGDEDMQGGYVQLTRSKERTDLYLTVGPEPFGADEERPHPARKQRAPEELLARVLSRDGSKTLASDTPDVVDVRRWSTRELRAERDRLMRLRAECPPDRSRELRLAAQRAAEAEQARRQARTDHQTASEQVAALQGSWRRRELVAARDWLVLAQHALQTTTGQADQAAERLGILRRAQQRHLGWMEAHDAELRAQERTVAREDAWRRRVDQRALALDPPGWLLAEFGPVPSDPRERAVWRVAAAELDAYRRATAWSTRHRRSMLGAGWPGTIGRLHRPRPRPLRGTARRAGRRDAAAIVSVPASRSGRDANPRPPRIATGSTTAGCWAPSPAVTPPVAGATGCRFAPRWSAWPTTTAAAMTTATTRLSAPATSEAGTWATRNATAASWQKGATACASTPTPTTSTTRTSTATTRRTTRSAARSTRAPG